MIINTIINLGVYSKPIFIFQMKATGLNESAFAGK